MNVKSVYDDTFYHRSMPTIGKKRCSDILNNLHPNFKIEDTLLKFEDTKTGHIGIQKLYRNGTILNF